MKKIISLNAALFAAFTLTAGSGFAMDSNSISRVPSLMSSRTTNNGMGVTLNVKKEEKENSGHRVILNAPLTKSIHSTPQKLTPLDSQPREETISYNPNLFQGSSAKMEEIHQYNSSNSGTKNRLSFTKEEDEAITKYGMENSQQNWNTFVQENNFKHSPRQCRERWQNTLNPNVHGIQKAWTQEEDRLLFQKYQEFGPHWKEIKKFFKDRSKNDLKNRFNSKAFQKKYLYSVISPTTGLPTMSTEFWDALSSFDSNYVPLFGASRRGTQEDLNEFDPDLNPRLQPIF